MLDIGDFQVTLIRGTDSVQFRCRPCDSSVVVSLRDPLGRMIAADFCERHAHPDVRRLTHVVLVAYDEQPPADEA